MSQQPGWYDDPQDDQNLRYWDGVQWSHHTSPKRMPGLDQAGAPLPRTHREKKCQEHGTPVFRRRVRKVHFDTLLVLSQLGYHLLRAAVGF